MVNKPFRVKSNIVCYDGTSEGALTDVGGDVTDDNAFGLAFNKFLTFSNTTHSVTLAANDDVSQAHGIYIQNPNTEWYASPKNVQLFQASGTWEIVPVGRYVVIECWSGGGSGGVRNGTGIGGGGGGGGSYKVAYIEHADFLGPNNGVDYHASGIHNVVVGAGGAAKAAQGPGVNGGASYVGNTSVLVWCWTGGGCGGGNTGTSVKGGHGGSPMSDPMTAGTFLNDNEGWKDGLSHTWFHNSLSDYPSNGANGTSEAVMGVMGYGGGGGGGNAASQLFGSPAFCGGAGGGEASYPTVAIGSTNGTDRGPGFWTSTILQSFGSSGGIGGTGANNTIAAVAGTWPGGGGGGGCNTGGTLKASGAGGNGAVIITVF